MANKQVGFGVLGLGMGQYHALAVSEVPTAKLVAVCDHDPERLHPVAAKYGVKGYLKYADMLADPEVEAVCIATESGTHVDRALEALDARKHLLIEKPIDVTVDKVNRLIAAVKKTNLKVTTVFQSRIVPLNLCIKKAVEEGRIGQLISVHAALPWYREQSYYEGPHGSWKGTWALDGGGSLANQGVHTVDLMHFFGGKIKTVFGAYSAYAHNIEAEDTTAAVLKFTNGAIGTIWTTTAAYPGLPTIVTIFGTRGTIQKQDDVLLQWKMMDEKEEDEEIRKRYGPSEKSHVGVSSDPFALGAYGHHGHIQDLVRCIREGGEPFITLESARHAVAVVNAIYASARTGRETEVVE